MIAIRFGTIIKFNVYINTAQRFDELNPVQKTLDFFIWTTLSTAEVRQSKPPMTAKAYDQLRLVFL